MTATRIESAPTPVSRGLLKQHAYEELKRRIQDATFAPGAFLSERQLAAQLGMSKTPIKAALERLEAEGFVAVSPQQGIVIRELSVQEIADQFEIRLALETFVLRKVAGRLDRNQAAKLRQHLQRQQRVARRRDLPEAIQLDSEFHSLFCEFLGNQEILRTMAQLRQKMYRVLASVYRQHLDRLTSSYQEHEAIARAVLDGDPDHAAARIEEHLNYGRQFLLAPRS